LGNPFRLSKDGRQRGKSRHHVKHVSAPDLLVVKNPV